MHKRMVGAGAGSGLLGVDKRSFTNIGSQYSRPAGREEETTHMHMSGSLSGCMNTRYLWNPDITFT
jgi:hypothetical protein